MSQAQPAASQFTSLQSLPDGYRALVIGATGAIGSAFLAHLQSDPRCALAVGLGRHTQPAVDLDGEATIAAAAQQLKAQGRGTASSTPQACCMAPTACLKSAWAS